MEQLRNEVQPSDRLSPAEVEAVTRRYLEREEAIRKERERLESMPTLEDVAQALGTSPDEVAAITQEVRANPQLLEDAYQQEPLRRKSRGTWPIHVSYLVTIVAILASFAWFFNYWWHAVIPVYQTPNDFAITNVRDPYTGVLKRNYGAGLMGFPQPDNLVTDASLVSPPRGIKLTLVTPIDRKTIIGPYGTPLAGDSTAKRLREAILSLVRYEEATMSVEGKLPVVKLDSAPFDMATSDPFGRPDYVGWHVMEISDGRSTFRGAIPDARYFRNDPKGYQRCLYERLRWLSDSKFVPGQPPSRLKGIAHRLAAPLQLPPGVVLSMDNGTTSVWARGPAPWPNTGDKFTQERVAMMLMNFVTEVKRSGLIAGKPALVNNKGDNDVSLSAVYPGGELTWPYYPLFDDPDYTAPESSEKIRQDRVNDMAINITSSLLAHRSIASRGTIHYGGPPVPSR